jgi:phytochrome B
LNFLSRFEHLKSLLVVQVLKEMWHAGCRVTHPGSGLPEELVHEMFDRGRGMTQEGLGLSMCRKLVKLMNGDMQYIRDVGKSYFLVNVELPLAQRDDAGSVK